jgi:antitoxin (DNA-binding transcriptional repressor) of toxin-antitoxin stability system
MAEAVGIREARGRLAELVSRAEQGETAVITRGGREVARPGPPLRREQRRPGRMKGRMWVAPDWDETPADLIAAMEGADERRW